MIKTRGDILNNRRKKRNKRILISCIVAVFVFSFFSLFISRNQTKIEKMFSNSIAVYEYYLIKKPISFVGDLFSEYNALKDVYQENKILKEKLNSYASVEANTDVLSSEIKKLKDLTKINYLPSEYKTKTAGVVTRDASNWNNEILLDVGSMGNVEEGMVVCDSQGMIGTISSVTEISATVSLLTTQNPTKQVPVMILNGNDTLYGLMDGYDVNRGYLSITLLSDVEKLEKNAKVYTSGLGGDGMSPKGIYIGTSKKLSVKSDGTTTKLYVKPAANFNDLSYVAVVKKVNSHE